MRGSLVRARRASISSAGLQWACMSIMAVLLSLSSNGLTPKVPVCGRLFPNYREIYFNRHTEASAFPHPCCWARGLALKYHGCGLCCSARTNTFEFSSQLLARDRRAVAFAKFAVLILALPEVCSLSNSA